MTIDPRQDPHAHIVVKPLPSQRAEKGAAAAPSGGRQDGLGRSGASDDPFVRAENEDDDGYDPYSDRPAEREPLFSEDPWS